MKYAIERLGSQVVRCGVGGTKPLFGGVVELVDEAVPLPAYWDGEKAVSITPPTPHHEFDYGKKEWCLNRDRAWWEVRRDRDAKLAKTDYKVIRAAENGEPLPAAWRDYRQALRDITKQPDPLNIVWPLEPD